MDREREQTCVMTRHGGVDKSGGRRYIRDYGMRGIPYGRD